LNDDEQNPEAGDIDGDSGKSIARLGTERAGAADTAQGAHESAAFAALNEDQENQKRAGQNHQQIEDCRRPGNDNHLTHGGFLSIGAASRAHLRNK